VNNCVFCELAAGKGDRSLAYEDDTAVAIMDRAPINEGHVLVLPKAHAAGLADLDQEVGGHLFRVAMKIAAAVRTTAVRCDGVNLWLADGEAAGQDVFHVHVHVLPRYEGDAFRVERRGGFQREDRPALDRVAASIREALAG
jgi:histidine triad (HIT) family protein